MNETKGLDNKIQSNSLNRHLSEDKIYTSSYYHVFMNPKKSEQTVNIPLL